MLSVLQAVSILSKSGVGGGAYLCRSVPVSSAAA